MVIVLLALAVEKAKGSRLASEFGNFFHLDVAAFAENAGAAAVDVGGGMLAGGCC